jgi:hypothetical protein
VVLRFLRPVPMNGPAVKVIRLKEGECESVALRPVHRQEYVAAPWRRVASGRGALA